VYDALPPEEQEQVRRELRAQHYGSLTFIDEQIGRVLDGLEARGELENTTIVFTSDHGSALFDNGMLHKGGHFPSQAIVPFVVWHPGTVTPGVRTNFSAHVDLYPTLMEIAGGAPHQGCEGTSIVPMLGDMFQWRECLGPPDVIAQFRKSYLGQYQQMSELDEAQRPGRVGKHVPAAYRSGPSAH
jgi:arylsulfatase A-like enzyme